MRFAGLGFGTGYRTIAFDAGFKKLMSEYVRPDYCSVVACRLIVL
jgi:hypothetical protein